MPYVMVGTENGASMAVLLLGLAGVAPAPVPARESSLHQTRGAPTPRDDPDATRLTEPPDKNGDAPDEYAADIARETKPDSGSCRWTARGGCGVPQPGADARGIGMGTRWAALAAELAKITQPALVASGHRNIMAPAINSYILAQHLPDAQLITYPGSGHGFLFQYPSLFAAHAARFPGTDATVA